MTRDKWIKAAKQLPVGSRMRVKCCGTDNSRSLGHLTDKYISGCFRCGKGYVEMKTGIARLSAEHCSRAKAELREFSAPKDTTLNSMEFPESVVAWLSKAGIHQNVWEQYGIGYSKFYDRVVVPIAMDGRRVGATLRTTDPAVAPKYLTSMESGGVVMTGADNNGCGSVVITEDILSAIRVGQATSHVDVVCILGTSVVMERVHYLATKYTAVIIWLDGDEAGQRATSKWSKRLRNYTRVIEVTPTALARLFNDKFDDYTLLDPKDFTDEQIKYIIGELE